ncbi:MAG TPA: TonB-dependent receptor [Allosphingosinicella sp.]|nr:TonB-dependent receptor [Allosphingosinicella sp.]
MKTRRFAFLLLGSAFAAGSGAKAAAQDAPTTAPIPASQDLSQLSIEELAQLPVRSASKREEPLSAAPTALFVITGDDIVGSAADSLPEALRLAPNLNVQQVNGHEYAVSARGFNSIETANKLLVLMDGRSIYSTLHSGVFWDLRTPMLEDIAQIEVISGPGGTLYGPNAVNGVINITSRDAGETLGGLVRGTAGTFEQSAAARYGFPLGGAGALRVYANWFNFDQHPPAAIGPVLDDRFHGWRAGFRGDFATDRDHFTLQGDIFDNAIETLPEDGNEGHNILGRWTRELSGTSSFQFQAYYDYVERRYLLTFDSLERVDAEAQLNLRVGAHDIVIGGGVRTTRDEFINNLNAFQLNPQSRRLWVYNGFVQDRFALTPTLSLTAGIKAEDTSFTGIELLPNVRLAWRPDERTLLWAAVSRAVRTPSRIDRQLEFPPLLTGGSFQSEKLVAFEAGYRGQPTRRTTLSVSAFFNAYDDIRTTEFQPGGGLPIQLMNGLEGHTYGVEAWSVTQLTPWLRVNLGLSALWKRFHEKPGHADLAQRDALGHDPHLQLFLRAELNPVEWLRLNLGLRRIGALDAVAGAPRSGAYVEADANLTYRLSETLELFVAGNNLLHETHLESNDVQRVRLAQRSVHFGTRLRF